MKKEEVDVLGFLIDKKSIYSAISEFEKSDGEGYMILNFITGKIRFSKFYPGLSGGRLSRLIVLVTDRRMTENVTYDKIICEAEKCIRRGVYDNPLNCYLNYDWVFAHFKFPKKNYLDAGTYLKYKLVCIGDYGEKFADDVKVYGDGHYLYYDRSDKHSVPDFSKYVPLTKNFFIGAMNSLEEECRNYFHFPGSEELYRVINKIQLLRAAARFCDSTFLNLLIRRLNYEEN